MKLLFTLLLLSSSTAFGQYRTILGDKVSGMSGYQNFAKNPSCQNGISYISSSVGAPVVAKDTTIKVDTATGTSCKIDATGSGQTWSFDLGKIPVELKGGNCQVAFKHSGAPLLYKAYVTINSVKVSSEVVPVDSSSYVKEEILAFPCGDDTTNAAYLVFESTSASAAQLNMAKISLSENRNIGTVAQAEYVGSITITGCAAGWNSTSASYTQPAVTTGCVYTSTTSKIAAPSTMLPGFNLSGPAGKYVVTFTGGFGKSSSTAYSPLFRMAGFGVFSPEEALVLGGGTTSMLQSEFSGTLLTNAAISNTPVVIQIKSDGTNAGSIYGQTAFPGTFKVYRFPLDSEQVLRLNVEPTDKAMTLGSCSTNWSPQTVVCYWSKNADKMTVNFSITLNSTPPAADLSIGIPSGIGAVIDTSKIPVTSTYSGAFQSKVTLYDNVTRIYQGGATYGSTTAVTITHSESGNLGVVNASNPFAWVSGDVVSGSFTVPIVGWTASSTIMPLVKQSVVSSYDGVMNTVLANVNCSGASNASSYTGGISSVTNISSGSCTVNFTAGTFSQAPICATTAINCGAPSGTQCFIQATATPSTSAWTFKAVSDSSGVSTAYNVNLICMGPR